MGTEVRVLGITRETRTETTFTAAAGGLNYSVQLMQDSQGTRIALYGDLRDGAGRPLSLFDESPKVVRAVIALLHEALTADEQSRVRKG